MTKWEYYEIEINFDPILGITSNGYKYKTNGKHDMTDGKYGVLMAELGEQGWELVSSNYRQSPAGQKVHLFFKRPKE